jgi:hypothetical protein
MDINKRGFVSIDTDEGPGLADGLGCAAATDATAVVVDPQC